MYNSERTRISDDHHNLVATHGMRVATVVSVNLDTNQITGVTTIHRFEDTHVLESTYTQSPMGKMDKHHELLDYHGDDGDVVRKYFDDVIESQKQSDNEKRFTWELIGGNSDVETDADLTTLFETVVGPERLYPPFDIPDDKPVAKLDMTARERDILRESNDRFGSASVQIHSHRGTTYVIGLTTELSKKLSEGCFTLKQEYKEMDLFDAINAADSVESDILSVDTEIHNSTPTA